MGAWYKAVNERISEAGECQSAEEIIDLLGLPDIIELDGFEVSSDDLLSHLSTANALSGIDVFLVYNDPYRDTKSYSFEFPGSAEKQALILLPFKISDVQPDRNVSASIMHHEIAAAESALCFKFPKDYSDFISRLGEGLLASFVRVYPPSRVMSGINCVASWRQRIAEYWFWNEGEDVLDQETATECVIFADTQNGDELVFHPSNSNKIFVLPRYQERSFVASSDGLESAITWVLNSGVLIPPIESREFESLGSNT